MSLGKILVVDDEQALRRLITIGLEREGFDVSAARDGVEGLEMAKKLTPDIIISDLMMPRMNGTELCRRVRADASLTDTFFIMLTAKARVEDRIEGLQTGADDYVTKPFDPKELVARVNSNMRVRKLQQELRALSELKDEFLGIAAHDLRTPLTIINGWCDILINNMLGQLSGEQREAAENIHDQAQMMLSLINDLLDISKIESGKLDLTLESRDIKETLKCHGKVHSILAQNKGISIVIDAPDDLPKIWIDAEKIDQVLNNLVSNAIKFSRSGAQITISARPVDNTLEVSVADTGQGIAPEELDRLFQRFSQTSTRATGGEQGSGLGLAIAKKIVEMHSGSIWVESEQGVGSRFTFSLPIEKRKPSADGSENNAENDSEKKIVDQEG